MKTRLFAIATVTIVALSLLTACEPADTAVEGITTATTATTIATTATTIAKQTTTKVEEITMATTGDTTTVKQTTVITTTNPDAPLEGKTALFVGDSIAYGYATNGQGFAYHVKEMWHLDAAFNGAVNGAEVTPRKGNTQQYIYNQLETLTFWKVDYVLLHGGVNDAVGRPTFSEDVPLGTLSDDGNYDVSTLAGALEKEIAFALEAWPNAKIGYILNYDITDPYYRPRMNEYIDTIRKVCEKWNVPTLNLFDGKLCPSADGREMVSISELYDTIHGPNEFMADQFHPTEMGYKVLAKYIGEFMLSLPERR